MLRKLKNLSCLYPKTLQELFLTLDRYQGQAKILAGGTDLLVAMKKGILAPQYLVNIKGIEGLDEISYDAPSGILKIGALASIASIVHSPLIEGPFDLLRQAASVLASPQIRNMATMGGNLCNASPAADLAPALLALGGQVGIAGPSGERQLSIREFFQGPGRTAVKPNEIVTQIRIPRPGEGASGRYIKYSPGRPSDLALASAASMLELEPGPASTCKSARIALGAVAEIPMLVGEAGEYLAGRQLDERTISEVSQLAARSARPIDDLRGTAWYRREIIKVIVQRSLTDILLGHGS